MLVASNDQKGHIAPNFDHFELTKAGEQLKMPSASHDAVPALKALHDLKIHVAPHFDYLD